MRIRSSAQGPNLQASVDPPRYVTYVRTGLRSSAFVRLCRITYRAYVPGGRVAVGNPLRGGESATDGSTTSDRKTAKRRSPLPTKLYSGRSAVVLAGPITRPTATIAAFPSLSLQQMTMVNSDDDFDGDDGADHRQQPSAPSYRCRYAHPWRTLFEQTAAVRSRGSRRRRGTGMDEDTERDRHAPSGTESLTPFGVKRGRRRRHMLYHDASCAMTGTGTGSWPGQGWRCCPESTIGRHLLPERTPRHRCPLGFTMGFTMDGRARRRSSTARTSNYVRTEYGALRRESRRVSISGDCASG